MQASAYTAGSETYTFNNPCDYFTYGKAKASTLSLSVLVAIEMFNAMNALSEVRFLGSVNPWCGVLWYCLLCNANEGCKTVVHPELPEMQSRSEGLSCTFNA